MLGAHTTLHANFSCKANTKSHSRSSRLQTLYIGCQNTSLQWFDCGALPRSPASKSTPPSLSGVTLPSSSSGSTSGTSTPSRKAHKFFDSYPQYERRPADLFASNGAAPPASDCVRLAVPGPPRMALHVPAANVVDSAHYGYIYCMALVPSARDGSDDDPESEPVVLVTGSGDESFKVRSRRSGDVG